MQVVFYFKSKTIEFISNNHFLLVLLYAEAMYATKTEMEQLMLHVNINSTSS